jgi:hypothetical protein
LPLSPAGVALCGYFAVVNDNDIIGFGGFLHVMSGQKNVISVSFCNVSMVSLPPCASAGRACVWVHLKKELGCVLPTPALYRSGAVDRPRASRIGALPNPQYLQP